jgi:hypothetical protein
MKALKFKLLPCEYEGIGYDNYINIYVIITKKIVTLSQILDILFDTKYVIFDHFQYIIINSIRNAIDEKIFFRRL